MCDKVGTATERDFASPCPTINLGRALLCSPVAVQGTETVLLVEETVLPSELAARLGLQVGSMRVHGGQM